MQADLLLLQLAGIWLRSFVYSLWVKSTDAVTEKSAVDFAGWA